MSRFVGIRRYSLRFSLPRQNIRPVKVYAGKNCYGLYPSPLEGCGRSAYTNVIPNNRKLLCGGRKGHRPGRLLAKGSSWPLCLVR